MIKGLFFLYFLASFFFFFYFIWKRKFFYSLFIAIAFIVIFASLAYWGSKQPNTWCTESRKAPFTSELPLKLETAQDYYVKGNFLYDQGSCNDAIANYSKAIELDPTISQFYNNRGYTYMMKNDYKNALNDFNKAIEIRPNYVRALVNRGDIYNYYYNVDKQKAIADYERIISQGKYAITDTSVCGHLLMARNGNWSVRAFPGIASLIINRGQNCN